VPDLIPRHTRSRNYFALWLHFKRVLLDVQIEYLPTQSSVQAAQMLKEFVALWDESLKSRPLLGHFVLVDPQFDEFGLSDNYSLQHMALHYVYLSTLLLQGTRGS
jgi:hypothetical protein